MEYKKKRVVLNNTNLLSKLFNMSSIYITQMKTNRLTDMKQKRESE